MPILSVKDLIQRSYFFKEWQLLSSLSCFAFLIKNYFVIVREVYTVEIMLRGRNTEAKFLI